MNIIRFEGDNRIYKKSTFKKHTVISCTEVRIDGNGNVLHCSFQNVRLDNVIKKRNKAQHECKFIESPIQQTLNKFFNRNQMEQPPSFNLDNLFYEICLLIGKQNLSLTFPISDEFYSFITFVLSVGAANLDKNKDVPLLTQAQQFFPHRQIQFYRDRLIETGRNVHDTTMHSFRSCEYVCVAIDEGSVLGTKNLDFILENPFHNWEAFPYKTIELNGEKAKDYKPALIEGLSLLSSHQIRLGSVVCDGNTAQKHCFKYGTTYTIRTCQDMPTRRAIFIPCLAHRVNNSFKNTIQQSENLKSQISALHLFAEELRIHRTQIGAACPMHISTRWVYDYDILNFIKQHFEKIASLTEIPFEETTLTYLFEVSTIFKKMILLFSDTSFPFPEAFLVIEKALKALNLLHSEGNPYALLFLEQLKSKTFDSPEGGLIILGYLLTKNGHDDFHNRIYSHIEPSYSKEELIQYFHISNLQNEDPLDEAVTDVLEDETILNESTDPNDIQGNEDVTHETEEEEEQEHNDQSSEQTHVERQHQISYIGKSKEYLSFLLKNTCNMSDFGVQRSIQAYTRYIDKEEMFEDCIVSDDYGSFKWMQISVQYPEYSRIADIASRLFNSVCSEASCERTLSAQKFIKNARRMTSKKDLLDARVFIMRSKPRLY